MTLLLPMVQVCSAMMLQSWKLLIEVRDQRVLAEVLRALGVDLDTVHGAGADAATQHQLLVVGELVIEPRASRCRRVRETGKFPRADRMGTNEAGSGSKLAAAWGRSSPAQSR